MAPTENTTKALNNEDVLATIQASVENGELDVNSHDENSITPLMKAAFEGQLDVVQYLLSKGARINEVTTGAPCIAHACVRGHVDVVKLLLEHGADVNLAGETNETALHCASKLEIVELLLDAGAITTTKDVEEATSLSLADLKGHDEMVKLLLDHGADVNLVGETNATALHCAHKAEIAKLLLDAGADVTAVDASRRDPLQVAILLGGVAGHFDTAEELLSRGMKLNEVAMGVPLISIAATMDLSESVKWLIRKGVDINALDEEGNTALDVAIGGSAETSILLLQNGAVLSEYIEDPEGGYKSIYGDFIEILCAPMEMIQAAVESGELEVNECDEDGVTPLMKAAAAGRLDVARYLLANGARVNEVAATASTSLTLAAQRGHIEMVKLLLEHGADVNLTGEATDTALNCASNSEIVKLLLDAGADMTAVNYYGLSSLQTAVLSNRLHAAEVLLSRGADLNELVNGAPLITVAASNDLSESVQWLINKGVDVNVADKEGKTAMDRALESTAYNSAALLRQHGAVTADGGEVVN